jgi:hypothetical protein
LPCRSFFSGDILFAVFYFSYVFFYRLGAGDRTFFFCCIGVLFEAGDFFYCVFSFPYRLGGGVTDDAVCYF